MSTVVISEEMKRDLLTYLKNDSKELIHTYLRYLELKFDIHPVLIPHEKMIYQSLTEAVGDLEKNGKLYRQAEIKIQFSPHSVNNETKRVYICPFTGKVFGDNTHPNPQDAIYDWVSKCPENTERVGGMRVKRFFVSEDQEVIKSYIPKEKPKEGVTKTVFSSQMSGKLYASKNKVVEELKGSYVKPLSLMEVQGQNRFNIEQQFLTFLQGQLVEEKIASFIEALADDEAFQSYIAEWLS